MFKFGCNSSNKKSISETLDEIAYYYNVLDSSPLSASNYKDLGKLLDSGDKGVREGTLSVLQEDYKFVSDEIWIKIKPHLSLKAKGLLEQRIKAVGGNIPGQSSLGKSKVNDPMNKSMNRSINQRLGGGMGGGLNASINSKNGSIGINKR